MFSKLTHQQEQHLHQQQQQQPFQFSRECQTSEDENSGGHTPSAAVPHKLASGGSSGDGASIEVARRPRGRPPGSKNKPKPPIVITREPEPAISPFILELPAGCDVVQALTSFSTRKNTSLCVLHAAGAVANVTLRQPSVTPGPTVTIRGRLEIISISATILLHASPAVPNGFAVSLAAPQGHIIGGFVVGRLITACTVFVTAASFNNPSYHQLSSSEDARNNSASGGGDAQSPPVSGGGAESGLYSCQLPSAGIWAPTARPPF